MDKVVKRDALSIFNKVINILELKGEKDTSEIKNLSNHTIHNASVFQDECSTSLAVIIYALSKIIERQPDHLNYNLIVKILKNARKSLINNDINSFKLAIKGLFSEVSKIDNKLNLYVQEVISHAQIKKGCKLCDHGLSAAKASQVLGISQWELLKFAGNISSDDEAPKIVDVRTRLKFARSLFS